MVSLVQARSVEIYSLGAALGSVIHLLLFSADKDDCTVGVLRAELVEDVQLVRFETGALYVRNVTRKKVIDDAVGSHESCVRCVADSTFRKLLASTAFETRMIVWKWTSTEGLRLVGNRLSNLAKATCLSFAHIALPVGYGEDTEKADSDVQDRIIGFSYWSSVRYQCYVRKVNISKGATTLDFACSCALLHTQTTYI